MKLAILGAAVLGLAQAATLPCQAPRGDDAAVRQVIATYLHGLKFNDTTDFHRAFWPNALLLFVNKQGGLGQLTQAQWYQGFAKVAGKEEEGTLRIASVEVVANVASVKVVEEYPTSRYTDFVSLVKFDGSWRIVNKIYTSEKKGS